MAISSKSTSGRSNLTVGQTFPYWIMEGLPVIQAHRHGDTTNHDCLRVPSYLPGTGSLSPCPCRFSDFGGRGTLCCGILEVVCQCDLTPAKVKLGQFYVESVDFVGTQVPYEEARAVGSDAAPPIGRSSLIAKQTLEIGDLLRVYLADLDPPKSGMIGKRTVIVEVSSILRPIEKADRARLTNPI
jgi:hypothetical protein